MKHSHSADGPVNVKVDLPTQDIDAVVDNAMAGAIVVIGFYMAADVIRFAIKSAFK